MMKSLSCYVCESAASYAGIKDMIPPYLDPTLTVDDLKTGVCFASAGTGFDPLTAQINVSLSPSISLTHNTKVASIVGLTKDLTKQPN